MNDKNPGYLCMSDRVLIPRGCCIDSCNYAVHNSFVIPPKIVKSPPTFCIHHTSYLLFLRSQGLYASLKSRTPNDAKQMLKDD